VGEVVEPLPHVDRTLTLLTPPFGCSTPAVYRAWDDLGGLTGDGPNDLERAALAGETPVLAGSGSTWFVEGAFPEVGGVVVVRTVPEGYGQSTTAP
jgi:4-diphosphocytidyl-2-C-methyl-D-erythritol kinase